MKNPNEKYATKINSRNLIKTRKLSSSKKKVKQTSYSRDSLSFHQQSETYELNS